MISRSHSHARTALVAALAAIALGLAACGGDEPAAEAVEAATTTPAVATTVAPAPAATTTLAPVELANDGVNVVTVPPFTVRESLSVAVVGDSLTVAATELIDVALNAIGMEVVTIDGIEGRRITGGAVVPGVDAIETIIAGGADPDVWVIALGTNDIGAKVVGDAAATAANEVLALLPPDAPVVWVNAWIRDQAGDAALFNNVVSEVLAARGNTTIVDWYDNAKDDGLISADGVHLTDLGEARFASQMAAGIIDLVGR